MTNADLTFDRLIGSIEEVHGQLSRLPAPLRPIWETPSPESHTPGDTLLRTLSFSHLDALLRLDEPEKQRFYEQRCIQATWSVRELSRQIASLYYERFVDLVFYHRVLKCHVLVELKVGAFTHEHIGQLNTYVSWYAADEMTEGDGPPIGLLLCTEKDHTVVKYALAGMSNQLFVSRYKVALPSESEIQGMLAEVLA